MKILFCAGFGPIVRDDNSLHSYRDVLGLPLGDADYAATDQVDGVKHFGLWKLADAARSCFDTDTWPADVAIPQAGLEFDVDDVAGAVAELQQRGCQVLVGPRTEPWGQEVARLLSPEGLLVGLTNTPWMREDTTS